MEKILIGKVANVVGLKGELKIYSYCEDNTRFETLNEIYIGKEQFEIEKVRYKDHMVILKVKGIDNRDSSEKMKTLEVFMNEEDLEELPEGVHYIKDIIGMEVYSLEDDYIGQLKDVLTNTPQKIYVVERKNAKDVLIPGVDEFIKQIDMENNKIIVKVIEGLYED